MPQADLLIQGFDNYYTSEQVYEEAVGDAPGAHFEGQVSFPQAKPGTVVFTAWSGDRKMWLTDEDGAGGILHGSEGGLCSINYRTGRFNITFSDNVTSRVLASYRSTLGADPRETAAARPRRQVIEINRIECEWCGRHYQQNDHGCPGCGAAQ